MTQAFEDSKLDTPVQGRFDRLQRLVGPLNLQKLADAHVMILGLGGVGSWAAESLARSGIGRMTIVDFDQVCITNTNRQLHAMSSTVGFEKSGLVAQRLRLINPDLQLEDLVSYYDEKTSDEILARRPDFILDAIDKLSAKTHFLKTAREQKLRVITSCGAAARLDPAQVKIADLSETFNDPMAEQLRKNLRQKFDFPHKGSWGIPAVFSTERPLSGYALPADSGDQNKINGTVSFVTGTFGLHMASWVVRQILESE